MCLPESHSPAPGSNPPVRGRGRLRGPGSFAPVSSRLTIAACRRLCSWVETEKDLDGERLFSCSGCGSEWVASEGWTPVDHTGVVPEAVQAERRRGRGWQRGQK